MSINQILVLNENEYKEKVVNIINPNWDNELLATHTLNYKDDFTIIDVLVKKRKIFS